MGAPSRKIVVVVGVGVFFYHETPNFNHNFPGVNILHYSQIIHLGKVSNFSNFWEEFLGLQLRALCRKLAVLCNSLGKGSSESSNATLKTFPGKTLFRKLYITAIKDMWEKFWQNRETSQLEKFIRKQY